jgi:putative photosynthetic complex assembly protein 2
VSAANLVLPFAVVILLWFAGTGLVAMIHHRLRASFGRALFAACACAIIGLSVVIATMDMLAPWAIYASFLGGLLIWSWHEISFLTGAIAGTHVRTCPADASGWQRFSLATAALIHHEVALAMTAALLLSLGAVTANATAAYAFALLFLFRLSSKLNLYCGVPNFSDELLPRHLDYLRSYFGPQRVQPLLPLSIAAITALGCYFFYAALTGDNAAAVVQAGLLACLCLLGALEHLFLALPFRDSQLWAWALDRERD